MPNSTSIKSIPQICVSTDTGNMIPGMMDNAYIKALNVTFGLTDKPTTMSMGLLSEDGLYQDYQNYLSFLSPYYIRVGGITFVMYLRKCDYEHSSEVKTCTLEFVDGSHILDRVFIGLMGTHTDEPNCWYNTIQYATIPVLCEPCYKQNTFNIPDPNAMGIINVTPFNYPPIYTQRFLKKSTLTFRGNNRDGGFLIVGDEKFKKTQCAIGDFDYSFTDLKRGLLAMGIVIDIPDLSLVRGIPYLRRNYSGPLRKVLSDWCADFGITWSWDYSSLIPRAFGINLRFGTNAQQIGVIATTAKLISSQTGALITNIKESRSLEGTYKKFHCTRYIQQAKARDFNKTTYYWTGYKNITTYDLLTPAALDGRNYNTFDTSCCFAKHHKDARILFNWLYATYTGNLNILRPLGFMHYYTIPNNVLANGKWVNVRDEVIDKCTDNKTYDKITKIFDPGDNGNYEMFIGLFSEKLAKQYLDWEKKIADDFMGKYFYTNLFDFSNEEFGGINVCFTGANWRGSLKSKFSPKPKTIFAAPLQLGQIAMNQQRLPFAKCCYGPLNTNLWTQFNWFTQPYIKIYKRGDAAWPQTQENIDNLFSFKTAAGVEDLLQPLMPIFQPIKGRVRTLLKSRFKNQKDIDIEQMIENAEANNQVAMLVIGPKSNTISSRFQTSGMMVALNPKESNYIMKSWKQPKLDCDASTYCEIQENLEKYVCEPYPRCAYYQLLPQGITIANAIGKIFNVRQNQPWPEGLTTTHAKGFYVQFKRKGTVVTLPIIMPAATWPHIGNIYLANYSETTRYYYWNFGMHQVLGDVAFAPAGNVERIEVTMDDQGSNQPLFSSKSGTLTKVFVNGVGFISLTQYHRFVSMFSVMANTNPKRDLSVTFGGCEFGALAPYMGPSFGLNSLGVSIGSDGISTTASWSSQLPTPPKQDLFTSEIGPKVIGGRAF